MPSHYTRDFLQLVRQMSGPEKAYFKKMAKRHAHQNQALHLRLFDLIEHSDHDIEELFRQKLSLATKAHYSSLKKYLTKEILDTVIFLQRNDSPDIRIRFYVLQVEILLERNLVALARKRYKQAFQLATAYNAFDHGKQLLMLQQRLLEHSSYQEYKAKASLIDRQIREYSSLQLQLEKSSLLFEQLNALGRHSPLCPDEESLQDIRRLEDELQSPLADREPPLLQLLSLLNKMSGAYLCHRFEEAAQLATALLACWQQHPHLLTAHPRYFLKSADITFCTDFALRDHAAATTRHQAYHQLARPLQSGHHSLYWQLLSFDTRLKIAYKTGRYDEVALLLRQEAQRILDLAATTAFPADQLGVLGSIATCYFVLECWEEAEEAMLRIRASNKEAQREDILYFSTLFFLLILYEKKDWRRLDHAAETAYHYLYTRKKLRPFEKDLMLFLKKLPTARIHGESLTTMSGFLQKLHAYRNDPVRQLYFLHFNYYGWFESKVMGISYREYALRKSREEQEPALAVP